MSGTNGCSLTGSYELEENAPLTVSYSKTDPCPGATDGSITALPSNGKAPYSYLWSYQGRTTQTISGIQAGTYYCTVRDACPTTVIITVTLSSPPALSGVTLQRVPSNPCVNTAQFTAVPNGGKAPYSYVWRSPTPTGPIVGTTQTITNRPPQIQHYVTVTDACGATKSTSGSAGKLYVSLTPSAGCTQPGQCTGWAQIDPSNEYPPYTYLWDANTGNQTTQRAVNLCYNSTGYKVTVTDTYGCTYAYSGTGTRVLNCSKSFVSEPEPDIEIAVFPVPTNDRLFVQFLSEEVVYKKLAIYNANGQMMYEQNLSSIDIEVEISLLNYNEGFYLLRLESDEKAYSKPFIIKR